MTGGLLKIKISKKQWELIGNKTGWIKKAQSDNKKSLRFPMVCNECHGEKIVHVKRKNLAYDDRMESCPSCNGKGVITQEDYDRYLHNIGIKPCPHEPCPHD